MSEQIKLPKEKKTKHSDKRVILPRRYSNPKQCYKTVEAKTEKIKGK